LVFFYLPILLPFSRTAHTSAGRTPGSCAPPPLPADAFCVRAALHTHGSSAVFCSRDTSGGAAAALQTAGRTGRAGVYERVLETPLPSRLTTNTQDAHWLDGDDITMPDSRCALTTTTQRHAPPWKKRTYDNDRATPCYIIPPTAALPPRVFSTRPGALRPHGRWAHHRCFVRTAETSALNMVFALRFYLRFYPALPAF